MREPPAPTRAAILDVARSWAADGVRSRAWPRRRARLPGRGRLQELLTDPAPREWLRRARHPERGRLGDDDRLIGLLLIRDETDVITESLTLATNWFDRIFVLDGTRDPDQRGQLRQILDTFPEVVEVLHDEDVAHGPVRDGIRQVLLDRVRARYGVDNWIGLLHADEFLDQDPRPLLATFTPRTTATERVRLVHFFLHRDDAPRWANLADEPLRTRVTHAMWPGVPETRFFFDAGDRDYDPTLHSKVVPRSFRNGPLIDGYVIAQYNERSPEQVTDRARSRAETGWQDGHYARLRDPAPDVFTETLDLDDAPFAPEFRSWTEPRPTVVRATDLALDIAATQPVFVIGDIDIEGHRAELGLTDDHHFIATGCDHIIAAGGLLDLIVHPTHRRCLRWEAAMRNLGPASPLVPNFGWIATGGRPTSTPGYLDGVRLVARVLRSRHTTMRQRRTAARAFVLRTAIATSGGVPVWVMSTPPEPARLRELRQLVPDARIVWIDGPANGAAGPCANTASELEIEIVTPTGG